MTPRARRLPALLGLALAATLVGGTPAAAERAPAPGAIGVGDPYFPRDGNGGIDVLHYDVHDRYAPATGRLSGRTGLDVRATQDLSRFDLDFLLPVRSVTVDGRKARFRLAGHHELRITPAAPLANGARFRLVVKYAGRPATERWQGESNWLADEHEVVTMNEPHMATWWFPANDHPSDKATFDIEITAPRRLDVVANGVLVGRHRHRGLATTHWRATEPMASYLAFFAVGSFEIRSMRCLGVPDVVAVSRHEPGFGRRTTAAELAQQTCDIVTGLAGLLGPYPFSAMGGLVTSLPVAFALENQTRPTYPAQGLPSTGLLVHELAHQWFGDSVSVSAWRDVWLNEGFAQFVQTYYTTERKGGEPVQDWLVESYDALAADSSFWDLSIDDPGPERLFDGPVYQRGAMALQALRHRVGDTVFWTLLRTWVSQRAYGNGSVADFEALAASLSGQDLTAFFTAWLHALVPPARTVENGLA